eukprot:scaffold7330_cov146-Cylindrotheca_fusiformis.AAC.17
MQRCEGVNSAFATTADQICPRTRMKTTKECESYFNGWHSTWHSSRLLRRGDVSIRTGGTVDHAAWCMEKMLFTGIKSTRWKACVCRASNVALIKRRAETCSLFSFKGSSSNILSDRKKKQ